MKVRFQKDGYVSKILTWGMSPRKKACYISNLQDGCPMFWRFIFMFLWTLGGWRDDGLEDMVTATSLPKKRNQTMMRINAAVSEFSETEAARRISKTLGVLFVGAIVVFLLGLVLLVCFGIYTFFSGGLETVRGGGIVLGAMAVLGVSGVLLLKGAARFTRWVGSTEAWVLFLQKAKSLKEKTCPVVSFV